MKIKTLISILNELPLTKTERELLDINISFLKHRFSMIKRVGIDGIKRLGSIVNLRLSLMNFLSGKIILEDENCIIINRF